MGNTTSLFMKGILFLICVGLVVVGQKTIGRPYILMQLVGLGGLLALLWDYNRKQV